MKSDLYDEPQYTKSQSEILEEIDKQRKKLKTLTVVPLVLLVFTMLLFVAAGVVASRAPLKTPTAFNGNSAPGDYVTASLIFATPAYEQYSVNTTTKAETVVATYYLAIDKQYNLFVIKCSKTYFQEHLAALEDNLETGDLQPVTVYANVEHLYEKIKDDPIEIPGLPAVNNQIQLEVLTEPAKEERLELLAVAFLFGTITLITGIICLSKKKKLKNTLQNLEDYGDVDAIYNQVCSNLKYEDSTLVSDGIYIISRNKKCIVETAEVLCLYQFVHRTNRVTDRVALVAVNKYGEPKHFTYALGQKDMIPGVIVQLFPFCPNALPGYTAETLQHINAKKIFRETKKKSKSDLD